MTCRWPHPPRPTEDAALRNLTRAGEAPRPEPTAMFAALAVAVRGRDVVGFDLTGRRIIRGTDDT